MIADGYLLLQKCRDVLAYIRRNRFALVHDIYRFEIIARKLSEISWMDHEPYACNKILCFSKIRRMNMPVEGNVRMA